MHAQGILSRGEWIPGFIDEAALSTSKSYRWRLLKIYGDVGLKLELVRNAEQSGIHEVLQRMTSGRLKVMRTLGNFWEQYRLYRRDAQGKIVEQKDLLMSCLRTLCVCDANSFRAEPKDPEPQYCDRSPSRSAGAWMR